MKRVPAKRTPAAWARAILWLVPVFVVLVFTSGVVIAALATVTLLLAKEQLGRDLARKRLAADQADAERDSP